MKKRVLFILSGSISAYKVLDLLKNLKEKNYDIEVILTKSGAEFVTALSLSSIINKKIHCDLFSKRKSEKYMRHISLSRNTDLVIVCPASANIIAKLANGYSDDLASTSLAASNKKIFIVPSMNKKMWSNPANIENISKLNKRKVEIIGPVKGNLACGEFGYGRMENIQTVEEKIEKFFSKKDLLKNKRILVTAGPTYEPIDPIRYISNFSSGKQGYAIANAANFYGAKTILISGPSLEPMPEVDTLVKINSGDEMYKETIKMFKRYKKIDAAICCAAISDWKITQSKRKYKKNENIFEKIKYKKNKDILSAIANLKKNRPKIVCGFSLETNNLILNSRKKLIEKNCDLIFANKISKDFDPMGSHKNKISLIGQNKLITWGLMSKEKIGEKIIEEISTYLN